MNLRRLLILSHRYLGIAISLMLVVWFASGIVMMYAGGMPRLDAQQRLERLPALDLSRVQISPADAAQRSALAEAEQRPQNAAVPGRRLRNGGGSMVLTSVMQRPAYRVQGPRTQTVFADSGEILNDIDVETARIIAARFIGQSSGPVRYARTLEALDQWTLGYGRDLPIHKFRVDDEAKTEIYVSPHTADVALVTTRKQRVLAWIGTIPHWLYFTSLKTNQPLWYQLVVWLSAFACVLTVLGLILGFTQFRRVRPFRLSAAIPYRSFMRWHYILGVIFGVFALTWAFSGLLSMEPFAWTNAQGLDMGRDVLSGGPPQLSSFDTMDQAAFNALAPGRTIKEISFTRIQDKHYYAISSTDNAPPMTDETERLHQPYAVAGRGEAERLLVSADNLQVLSQPFTTESIVTRLAAAAPDAQIVEQTLLTEYDSYYYSRGGQSPLPVLRVKYNDPAQSWFYIDPRTSQMLAQVHRYSRIERWLYNGLHSLDFRFWYSKRPLWDIGMITLLLGGLTSSGLGLYLGIKRLVRDCLPAKPGVNHTARVQ